MLGRNFAIVAADNLTTGEKAPGLSTFAKLIVATVEKVNPAYIYHGSPRKTPMGDEILNNAMKRRSFANHYPVM